MRALPTQSTTQAAPADSDEGLEKGNAEAGAALRHFSRGMPLDFAYFIYNARLAKTTDRAQVTTQVRLFRGGKQVFCRVDSSVRRLGTNRSETAHSNGPTAARH